MLIALLATVAGVWPQLPQIERYIDVCESAYMEYSQEPLPVEVDHISVWVGGKHSSIGFVQGDLGLVTREPAGGYELSWVCELENRTEEIYALGRNGEAPFIMPDSANYKRVVSDLNTEFDVVEFHVKQGVRRFLGSRRYSQQGIGVYFKRVRPSDVILNGYHSLAGLDELPPAHAGLVLPVAEASRYQDNNDGTVTDRTTGLMWQRCAVGREWREGRCEGEALVVPYQEAEVQVKWANHNSVAGYSDWRLPQIEELAGLVYCSSGQRNRIYPSGYGGECLGDYQVPTLMLEAFDKDVAWGGTQLMPFWSSSLWRNSDRTYWTVFFDTGFIADSRNKDRSAIRLVREVNP
ncbi:DUF1566 domain-containing protein [Alkalimonas sp. NCh-2]